MTANSDIVRQIAELEPRLDALDEERRQVAEHQIELKKRRDTPTGRAAQVNPPAATVTMTAPTAAKIALFRSLFRGREDVFPQRWNNAKTGKTGYSPQSRRSRRPRTAFGASHLVLTVAVTGPAIDGSGVRYCRPPLGARMSALGPNLQYSVCSEFIRSQIRKPASPGEVIICSLPQVGVEIATSEAWGSLCIGNGLGSLVKRRQR